VEQTDIGNQSMNVDRIASAVGLLKLGHSYQREDGNEEAKSSKETQKFAKNTDTGSEYKLLYIL
jgi:hypothetical protein